MNVTAMNPKSSAPLADPALVLGAGAADVPASVSANHEGHAGHHHHHHHDHSHHHGDRAEERGAGASAFTDVTNNRAVRPSLLMRSALGNRLAMAALALALVWALIAATIL